MQAGTLGEPNSLPLGPNRHDALQLVEADKAEHAHRSVGRLLRAGTEYRFEEASRAVCVESYKALLGRFFPDSGLPSFGGRLFLAGVSRSRGSFSQQMKAAYRPTSVIRAANKLLLSILQFILHAQAVFFHVLWHFCQQDVCCRRAGQHAAEVCHINRHCHLVSQTFKPKPGGP